MVANLMRLKSNLFEFSTLFVTFVPHVLGLSRTFCDSYSIYFFLGGVSRVETGILLIYHHAYPLEEVVLGNPTSSCGPRNEFSHIKQVFLNHAFEGY